ncbi:MAG TPA: insulinase family protein [Aridibacter sp.]|nr:insulinase family protein [Aridibacter sp.]
MKLLFSRFITCGLVLMFAVTSAIVAQDGMPDRPRSEKLLNELDVVIWSTAGTDRVTVRLRIHNGAAYDPRGKAGTFALLGDILFPEQGVRDYFREDLDGDVTVEVTYDYVEVTGTARADEFLTVLETLAPALMNTEITKETTEKLKTKQLAWLDDAGNDPKRAVSKAAATRLFGEFPYGRPVEGTPETIRSIDFADLIYVRERFLTADNATLSIVGDVRSDYAYLAARRLMGGWKKAGTEIPATFRLPEAPLKDTETIYVEGEVGRHGAAAVESFARKHRLYHAAEILSRVIDARLRMSSADREGLSAEASNEGFLLKGIFLVATADRSPEATVPGADSRLPARAGLIDWLSLPVTEKEFNEAHAAYFGELSRTGRDRLRADVETYGLGSAKDEMAAVRDLKIEDVRAAAKELLSRTAVEVVMISRPPAVPDVPADPKDPLRRDASEPDLK